MPSLESSSRTEHSFFCFRLERFKRAPPFTRSQTKNKEKKRKRKQKQDDAEEEDDDIKMFARKMNSI